MNKKHSFALKTLKKALDYWLPLRLQYDEAPGMSVAVWYKGRSVYERGFGVADVNKGTKVTSQTAFRVASMSKMFTAVAILKLQEQKKLRLSDSVSKHLPWFAGQNKNGNLNKITIRDLLNHSSGFTRDGNGNQWNSYNFPTHLEQTLNSTSLIFKRGLKYKYSNHGYAVLGEVVQAASGIPYNEYVMRHVIKPLGLKNTVPDLDRKLMKNLSIGYSRRVPGKPMVAFKHITTRAYASAAGFISTAPDIARFLSCLVNNSSDILTATSKKQLLNSVVKTTEKDYRYSLGLAHNRMVKRWIVGHSGGFPGFVTQAYVDPKTTLVVVVLPNRLGVNPFSIVASIFTLFFALVDAASVKKIKDLQRYEGVYRGRWSDEVVVGGGSQLFSFSANMPWPMKDVEKFKQVKKDDFIAIEKGSSVEGEPVTFSRFRNGKAQELRIGGMQLKRII